MNLTDAPLGHAFTGDYPESYGNRVPELRQIVARQLAELDARRAGARDAELLGVLRGRRCGRRDHSQIEVVPRRDGATSLVARGEILVPDEAYQLRGVRETLKAYGFQDVAERRGGLRVLRDAAAFRPRVAAALAESTRQGGTGSANYIATLAAVGKGIGGPEPVDGPGLPPAHALASHAVASHAVASHAPGPRVAVIDTGIPAAVRGDGWLAGVPREDDNIDVLDVFPCGKDGYLDFQAGHGAFVAGIVERVARGADIRLYKAADSDGFATDADIADALRRAYEDGAQVINLSLGMRTADDEPPPAMAGAVQEIVSASDGDVVIVAAAGNFGDAQPCWPASLPGVEAVAGLTAELAPAPWSSHGDVRFSTVGEGIRSTFVTGQESPVFDREPEEFGENAWALWTGTSFAAPQIAGAIVRVCRETGTGPRAAVELLASRGQPIAGYGSALRILEGVAE